MPICSYSVASKRYDWVPNFDYEVKDDVALGAEVFDRLDKRAAAVNLPGYSTQCRFNFIMSAPNRNVKDQRNSSSKDAKPANTLSSIVSNLVRAAIGGNHQDVPDQDLDKYVADMIMKSADNAHKRYEFVGLSAYTSSASTSSSISPAALDGKVQLASGVIIDRAHSNGLKTNKRFLSSIIKSTDDHNQALIRAEEKKATEMAKELIADLDRRAAERERDRKHSSRRTPRDNLILGGREGRDEMRIPGRMRMDEISSTSASASASAPPPSFSARPRSKSPSQWRKRSLSRSPSPTVKVRGRGSRKYEDIYQPESTSSPSRLGSKMDKYFQDGYDPLLDTHSADEAIKKDTKKRSKKHKERKMEKKDRKSKRDKDNDDRRIHSKKHKSSSSSTRSHRNHDSDSSDSTDRRHKSSGSSSRRRRDHGDGHSSDDSRSRNKPSNSSHKRSPSSSPDRTHRHKSSRSSGSKNDRKRTRKQTDLSCSSDDSDETDVEGDGTRAKGLSGSAKPKSPSPPPGATSGAREWDLHKINKDAVHAHLFGTKRKRPS
ncbi:hypothetical protein BGZ98_003535 [Dissophora globulifera]|nr:hypothetical protein BGZ98_003535 [Dissophora globulifera]